MGPTASPLLVDGYTLTTAQVLAVGHGDVNDIALVPQARDAMRQAHAQVEISRASGGRVMYGVTTGLGPLKGEAVGAAQQTEFQRRILLSHSTAVGEPWLEAVVRSAMLLRANVLARGHSGVRPALVDRLLAFLRAGLTPVACQEGSVGLGDLPCMAQIGLALAGMSQGRTMWRGQLGQAPDQISEAGLSPIFFPFQTREALSLISGSTMTLAAGIHAADRVGRLAATADLAAALTLEAMRGENAAFDHRTHDARPHPGQTISAERVRRYVAGSEWVTPQARTAMHEQSPRVQDVISLRCTPQVHGAVQDTLAFAQQTLAREINASTDNPLLFMKAEGEFEVISGGNSHGAHLGYVADFLAIALADLCVLSERRSALLLDPNRNHGLPANLVQGQIGLNSGLAVAQASATAMLGELRTLANPATGGSVPTKSNLEDHVSMGTWAVRKLTRALDLAEWVLAMELLCASQAIDHLREKLAGYRLGVGTGLAYQTIRQAIPAQTGDHLVSRSWEDLRRLVASGRLLTIADANQ